MGRGGGVLEARGGDEGGEAKAMAAAGGGVGGAEREVEAEMGVRESGGHWSGVVELYPLLPLWFGALGPRNDFPKNELLPAKILTFQTGYLKELVLAYLGTPRYFKEFCLYPVLFSSYLLLSFFKFIEVSQQLSYNFSYIFYKLS